MASLKFSIGTKCWHSSIRFRRDLASRMNISIKQRSIHQASIIPIPMNLGQPNLGPDMGPSSLIEGGLMTLLGDIGWRVKQLPPLPLASVSGSDSSRSREVPPSLRAKNCFDVGYNSELIRDYVLREIAPSAGSTGVDARGAAGNDSPFPLILGGDHCISIGTISAIKSVRKNTGVIWVDAHADINTPDNSVSGNMHGMPLAFLLGLVEGAKQLPGFGWVAPCLEARDLVYVGLRDLDAAERLTIKTLGIKAFTMHDVDRLGVGQVMEQALRHLDQCDQLHLSFDIDAIDPFFAPHTGTSVTGGLTFREGNYICEALSGSGRLTSMELVEVDPMQHAGVEHQKTVNMALTLIGSAMGQRIL